MNYDYEYCYNEAKKYKSRSEFKLNNEKLYRYTLKQKWIDDYTWFRRPNKDYWTYETCLKEAKKYKTKGEFLKNGRTAYEAAVKNGWINDFDWILDGRKRRWENSKKWTYKTCLEEAKKYKTRSEFAKYNSSAYRNACRYGWIEEYTWLKDKRFDLYKDKIDCVYVYEFEEFHVAYVGRTLIRCKKSRDLSHILYDKDSVSIFAREHNIPVPEPKYLADNLTLEDGVKQECYWIKKYKEMGWTMLNKVKGGSIGGLGCGKSRFTKEVCYNDALKYETRSDFKRNSGAYRVARKNCWLKDYTWFIDGNLRAANKRRKWTYKICYEEAKKYNSISEFYKGCPGALAAAKAHGWIKDYTWFVKLWEEKWNRETCYEEAKKYTSISEFGANSGSTYATACKNKWIDDYTWLKRQRKKKQYWTYETCLEEAKKYKTKKEFFENNESAYNKSYRSGWIKSFDWLL